MDLIYLDPPFNSNRTYSAIYKDEIGRPLPVQVEAFCDMWELTPERQKAIERIPIVVRDHGIDDMVAEFWRFWMNALRYTNPKLLAYLSYMVERLVLLKGILRATGSIYLHCDPTCSHYLKVMMDGIFGHENFQNEIVWKRTSAHSDSKKLGRVHDVVLHFSKTSRFTKNSMHVPYEQEYIDKRYNNTDPDGRKWMSSPITAKGLTGGGYEYSYKGVEDNWRVPLKRMKELDKSGQLHFTRTGRIRQKKYLDQMKGVPLGDIWNDVFPVNSQADERMGYATQKPLALLERIISASTNPGDVVLDPFCGCATTLEASHKLDRQWIGIDIAFHAVNRVARVRLEDRLNLKEGKDFEIKGVPLTVEGAQDLWEKDPYQFQKWAVERAEGFVSTKRTSDGGIDGRIYFSDSDTTHSMVVEVKGGEECKHIPRPGLAWRPGRRPGLDGWADHPASIAGTSKDQLQQVYGDECGARGDKG